MEGSVPAPASISCLGWGTRETVPASTFVLQKSPADPHLSNMHSETSQYMSFRGTLGAFQTAVSVLCLQPGYLVYWFFKGGDSVSHHPPSEF